MHAWGEWQLFHFGTNIYDSFWDIDPISFFMISYSFLAKKEDMDLLEISLDKVFPFAIPLFPDNEDELVSGNPYFL